MKRTRYSTDTPWEPRVGYSRAVRAGPFVCGHGHHRHGRLGQGASAPGDAYAQAVPGAAQRPGRAGGASGPGWRTWCAPACCVTDISRWEEVGRAHREFFGAILPGHHHGGGEPAPIDSGDARGDRGGRRLRRGLKNERDCRSCPRRAPPPRRITGQLSGSEFSRATTAPPSHRRARAPGRSGASGSCDTSLRVAGGRARSSPPQLRARAGLTRADHASPSTTLAAGGRLALDSGALRAGCGTSPSPGRVPARAADEDLVRRDVAAGGEDVRAPADARDASGWLANTFSFASVAVFFRLYLPNTRTRVTPGRPRRWPTKAPVTGSWLAGFGREARQPVRQRLAALARGVGERRHQLALARVGRWARPP